MHHVLESGPKGDFPVPSISGNASSMTIVKCHLASPLGQQDCHKAAQHPTSDATAESFRPVAKDNPLWRERLAREEKWYKNSLKVPGRSRFLHQISKQSNPQSKFNFTKQTCRILSTRPKMPCQATSTTQPPPRLEHRNTMILVVPMLALIRKLGSLFLKRCAIILTTMQIEPREQGRPKNRF